MPRGQLRIYLGAAPGVGKTYAMLQEGQRRAERGADVVIGIVESHGRRHTSDQIGGLEEVPRAAVSYRGSVFEEMDLEAIIERAPQICLVDELAHTNVPGSTNHKRYEDVETLLAAGIDVISTVNIQHLESLSDVVERITGVSQREIIPDALVRSADQIHLVDQTPEALRRRMVHGNIYGKDRAEEALANYFRLGNLSALRELALMWVADQVDEELHAYRDRHGISQGWETRERIIVAVTGAPSNDLVIRRAARIAARLRGELVGVRVRQTDGLASEDGPDLERHRQLLASLGARYREVASGDVAKALVDVARAENATQIVLGSSHRTWWAVLTKGSVINEVARRSGTIDVHIISSAPSDSVRPSTGPSRLNELPALSGRRRKIAWLLAMAVPAITTVVLQAAKDRLGLSSDLLIYLAGSVLVATVGGLPPALLSALTSSLLLNWYFTEPLHTFTIAEPESLLALLIFLAVAGLVGMLVSRAARRTVEAARARSFAESVGAMAALAVLEGTTDDPLVRMAQQARVATGATGAAIRTRNGTKWSSIASDWKEAGGPETGDRGENQESVSEQLDTRERMMPPAIEAPIDENTTLALWGDDLVNADAGVLAAFSSQITSALDRQRLRREAAAAERLVEVNDLRAALLASVSHDLRTPLAAIKASVSTLRQTDLVWPAEVEAELLATIEGQTDRLTQLVGNLLGMSRIQSGAVQLASRPVGVEEIASAALTSIDPQGHAVVTEIDEDLPPWMVDPGLAERIVANLLDNAMKWSPNGAEVRLLAVAHEQSVSLSVIDHGPGIPQERRTEVFEPFQRLGDGTVGGTGLGLAVARGLTNVLGGQLEIDDTPGGGTTMILTLAAAPRDSTQSRGSYTCEAS